MISTAELATSQESVRKKHTPFNGDSNVSDQFCESTLESSRKGAIWIKEGISAERRSRLRSRTAFEVEVCPLDEELEPVGSPQQATILNYSEEGVCLEHDSLIPEQYVSLTWSDSHHHQHVAVVRLKWCRSTEDHKILSGGRVCSMETFS